MMLPPSPWAISWRATALGHQEGAPQVHPHHLVPHVDGQLDHRHAVHSARGGGVVHHDVDAVVLVEHVGEQLGDGLLVGDVGHHRTRAAAQLPDLRGDGVDVAPAGGLLLLGVALGWAAGAGDHDVAPGAGQLDRDGATDGPHSPGAGDHDDRAGEPAQLEGHF